MVSGATAGRTPTAGHDSAAGGWTHREAPSLTSLAPRLGCLKDLAQLLTTVPTRALSMWLGFLSPWWLVSEREEAKSACFKKPGWHLHGFL